MREMSHYIKTRLPEFEKREDFFKLAPGTPEYEKHLSMVEKKIELAREFLLTRKDIPDNIRQFLWRLVNLERAERLTRPETNTLTEPLDLEGKGPKESESEDRQRENGE